ncbi:MAG: pyroglutamyl-peptidase I [Lachnospiraceae bacterium]|nr:pyroglutamyl-peptidase I [Lachnospiraceae bacterium]
MRTVLVTAFEPFGKDIENAAALVCGALPDQGCFLESPAARPLKAKNDLSDRTHLSAETAAGYRIVKQILPTEFKAGAQALLQAMDAARPHLVLCLGQAGSRSEITPERIAVNLMDARIPDNAGWQPDEEPVVPGGLPAYFTNVPVKAVVQAAQEAGCPAAVSDSAGTYVCNCVFYTLMNRIAATPANETTPPLWGDFIHVPYVRGQKGVPEEKPARTLAEITKTVQFFLEETLRQMENICPI